MPTLRQRHTERTRDAIVAAAYELFATKGFAETTVDEIAEAADVAPRTFFRYFPAKESVLFHDATEKVDATVELLRNRPAGEPPMESLLAVLGTMAARFGEGDSSQKLLAKQAAESERLFEHHRAVVMRDLEDAVSEVLIERAGEGADPIAIQAAVAAVLASFATAMRLWLRGGAEGDFCAVLDRCLGAAQEAFSRPQPIPSKSTAKSSRTR